MKEKMMRIIVTVMLTLLLCSLTLLAGAASKNDWKNTAGCYVWTESSQYNNGVLNIKPLGDDKYLYELKVMRGSEEEDSAEDFVTAGVFEINEDGDGIAEVDYQNNDTVELRFVLKDKSITAYQDGPLPLDVQGEYRFNEDSFDVSEAAAAALLAGLPEKQTGLPEDADDYKLLYAEEPVDGWFYQLTALDDEGKVIAKFLVAADLSAVYRNDKEDEVSLIYGDPINMLAAKRAPLVEEDELEGPAIESGELEGDEDAPDLPATAASELSPLVTVAPEEASLKVGERTRIVASLPGCVGYNVTDLRSSNSDIVKVDGDVQLLAVKPGTATITGKLLLEKGEKAFMTQITAYEPKLEAPNLPAHLGIDEALKLEAYVVGEADGVTPEWSVSDEILDILNDFTRDEEHSILMSSHIVSDIEKICDYFAFIHQGRLLLFGEKDEILSEYAVTKVSEEELCDIAPQALHGVKHTPYGAEALVEKHLAPETLRFEHTSLEDIIIFLAREGER